MSSVRPLVGSTRLNEGITPSAFVKKLGSKFPNSENFDLIEIFNNSVPNDPSPPSKALAVIHRSTNNAVPVATNIFTKILDYNNRDFYKWQTMKIVNDITSQWLKECGGGVLLTVHRDPASIDLLREDSVAARLNRYLNRNRNNADKKSIEIFSKSTEINGERNWKNFHELRYFWDLKWTPNPADCPPALTIFHTDNFRRIVYTRPVDPTISVDRKSMHQEMQKILHDSKCVEGIVLFDNPLSELETNFYHAFTVNQKLVNITESPLNSMPINYKHLIS